MKKKIQIKLFTNHCKKCSVDYDTIKDGVAHNCAEYKRIMDEDDAKAWKNLSRSEKFPLPTKEWLKKWN